MSLDFANTQNALLLGSINGIGTTSHIYQYASLDLSSTTSIPRNAGVFPAIAATNSGLPLDMTCICCWNQSNQDFPVSLVTRDVVMFPAHVQWNTNATTNFFRFVNQAGDVKYTANIAANSSAIYQVPGTDILLVKLPTPIDSSNMPDLRPLLSATSTVGKVLKKGDYVVYESTVYPGATEEDCIPILEEYSGLKAVTDFKVGYSPERINPGDTEHTITSIKKIVSGCDQESLDIIAKTYELIVKAGIHKASSIKVAEAAKAALVNIGAEK